MTKDSDFLENEIFLPRPKMLQSGVMWKASHMQPGSRALEALGFSVPKYAFFHFLEAMAMIYGDTAQCLHPYSRNNPSLDRSRVACVTALYAKHYTTGLMLLI